MPTLMDRITEFFKPKKHGQQQDAAKQASATMRTSTAPRKRAAKKATGRKPVAKKAASKAKPAAKAKTREQLYKEATRLKIVGRAKMSKAQLGQAIAKKKAK